MVKINIKTVQMKNSQAKYNLINPKYLFVGKNDNYNSISRVYIRISLLNINCNHLLKSAIMTIPILKSDEDKSYLSIYKVESCIENITDITWQNKDKIKLIGKIHKEKTFGNSFVSIDISAYLNREIKKGSKYLELLLFGNESEEVRSSGVIIKDDNLNNKGINIEIESCESFTRFHEKKEKICTAKKVAYSNSFVFYKYEMTTIFIKNKSRNKIIAVLENSYDNKCFISESDGFDVEPGTIQLTVPYYFSKYLRVKLRCMQGHHIDAEIIFQGILYLK